MAQPETLPRKVVVVKGGKTSRMTDEQRRQEAEKITRELETLKRRVAKLAE